MAFEPAAVDGLQDGVAQIYADAEVQLLRRVAASIEKGIDTPQWVTTQLSEIARLSKYARGFLLSLDPLVAQQIEAALAQALAAGVAGADSDVPGAPSTSPAPVVSQEAVAALAAETTAAVTSTHSQILRSVADGYRQVVGEVAGRVVTGVVTRREATQQALNKFAAQGLSSFRDKAGRNWRPDTYAEMCVRTAALRALEQGHTDRLTQRGYDLVLISSHHNSAPQCRPFQGKVLSLTGAIENGRTELVSPVTGDAVTVTVAASMREAEAAGLHHPNCKHAHTAYIPGAPRPPVVADDPQGYADEQKLRRLERQVREAKRVEAAAITPEAKKAAGAKVRARQAAIRQHVADTGVTRRSHREQLRTGDAARADESVKLARNPLPEFAKKSDEELADKAVKAVEDMDLDLLDRIEAEDAHRRVLAAKRAERWAKYERDYDALIAEGWEHEAAVEKAYGISVKTQRSQQAMAMLRGQGYEGKSFHEMARHAFKDRAYEHWLAAEEATNGYMLSKAGQAAGVDPRSLWFGNERTAEKYASEELRAYWDQHGRPTLDEFKADLLDPAAADRMRSARGDFLR
ncbi:phage minor capsid protein [Nocardia niigatensis]